MHVAQPPSTHTHLGQLPAGTWLKPPPASMHAPPRVHACITAEQRFGVQRIHPRSRPPSFRGTGHGSTSASRHVLSRHACVAVAGAGSQRTCQAPRISHMGNGSLTCATQHSSSDRGACSPVRCLSVGRGAMFIGPVVHHVLRPWKVCCSDTRAKVSRCGAAAGSPWSSSPRPGSQALNVTAVHLACSRQGSGLRGGTRCSTKRLRGPPRVARQRGVAPATETSPRGHPLRRPPNTRIQASSDVSGTSSKAVTRHVIRVQRHIPW